MPRVQAEVGEEEVRRVLAQGRQAGEDTLTNRVVQFLKDKEGDAVGELRDGEKEESKTDSVSGRQGAPPRPRPDPARPRRRRRINRLCLCRFSMYSVGWRLQTSNFCSNPVTQDVSAGTSSNVSEPAAARMAEPSLWRTPSLDSSYDQTSTLD